MKAKLTIVCVPRADLCKSALSLLLLNMVVCNLCGAGKTYFLAMKIFMYSIVISMLGGVDCNSARTS